jgi:hypothetical protein
MLLNLMQIAFGPQKQDSETSRSPSNSPVPSRHNTIFKLVFPIYDPLPWSGNPSIAISFPAPWS